MRCEFGYCMICDKETAKICGDCRVKKPTDQYTEVEVAWSNGSRMKIGVCVDCAVSGAYATSEAKSAITDAHWKHWIKSGHRFDEGIVVV